MTTNIRVGYDIDGTLANFVKAWTRQASQMYPSIDQVIDDKELDEYDFYEKYGTKARAVWNAIERRPLFYDEIEPMHDAVEDTTSLIELDEVEPHYITARAEATIRNYSNNMNKAQQAYQRRSIRNKTYDWLQRYGLRGGLHMNEDKAEACCLLGMDFYIDNKPESVLNVQYNTSTRAYLLDKEYNRGAEVRQRVSNVKEFNDEVRGLVDKL